MKFMDLPAAQFGRYGETIAARMLRGLGAGVIATFKFSGDGEAPAIELSERRIVLADLDVSMRGKTISVEIKTYGEPQRNRTHLCMVHGIPVRLFDEYVESERERGIPVHLGVLEVSTGSLLVSNDPISKISPRYGCQCEGNCESVRPSECAYRAEWGNAYPQWYFRRDTLKEWHRLQGADLAKLQSEHAKISGSLRRNSKPARSKAPWTWAHLVCNTTGTGKSTKHDCKPLEYLREIWTAQLRWALDADGVAMGAAAAREEIEQPITRDRLADLLGDRWMRDAGDETDHVQPSQIGGR